MNYKLKEKNGKIAYLTKSGNDYVLSHTMMENANWILNNGVVDKSAIPGKNDYQIHVEINGNEYYFEGSWDDQSGFDELSKRKRRTKDIWSM